MLEPRGAKNLKVRGKKIEFFKVGISVANEELALHCELRPRSVKLCKFLNLKTPIFQ